MAYYEITAPFVRRCTAPPTGAARYLVLIPSYSFEVSTGLVQNEFFTLKIHPKTNR